MSPNIGWALGFGGVWVVLALATDVGMGQLAAAFAALLALSATFAYLPGALRAAGVINK